MSEAHRGHLVSKETRKKISKSLMGHPVSEKTSKILRINSIGKHHSEETKLKMSKARKGRKTWNKGKKCPQISEALRGRMPNSIQEVGIWGHVKRGWYDINGKKMFFRSKWEANYALYLDFLIKQKQIEKWKYEKKVFIFEKIKFGTRSYRPDFEVHNLDKTITYHEVKGWMNSRSKIQLKRMAKYYPDIKLLIIDKDIYNDIKNKLGKMLKFY